MRTRILLSLFLISQVSFGAVASRIYTFSDGSILTASQLNNEFNNLVDTVNSIDTNNLTATAGILPAQISSTIAGSSINRNSTTGVLSLNTDNSTIEISSNALQVKDAGIIAAKIGALAVTTAKIDSSAVTTAKLDTAAVTTAKITDLNVTTGKIADLGVTTGKINTEAVTAAKVLTNIDFNGKSVRESGKNVVVAGTNEDNSLSIVRGEVNSSGTAVLGTGYSSVRNAVGIYTITLTDALLSGLTPVATSRLQDTTISTSSITSSSFIVRIRNLSNNDEDAGFTFISIGPRS